jgi:hypothetical protein
MTLHWLTRPPRSLRRPGVRLDNLALVPGNLLRYKRARQRIANSLPQGDVLIVLPGRDARQRKALEQLAARLQAKGRHVTTVRAERFR